LKEIVFDKNKTEKSTTEEQGDISMERKNALIDLAEKVTKEKDQNTD
jgi:hypothetical protein